MTNFVEACAATGARLVFVDNLYMYGPQTAPLSETTPLTPYRRQAGRARRGDAHLDGGERRRAGCASPRCARPISTGPGVAQAHLGETGVRRARATARPRPGGRLARHAARFRLCPGLRARRRHPARRARRRLRPSLARPLRADANAARNPRARRGGARREAARLRPAALGAWAARPVRSRSYAKCAKCGFSGTGPIASTSSRFARRFWADATPFEVGAPATALWFRDRPPDATALVTLRRRRAIPSRDARGPRVARRAMMAAASSLARDADAL